jgi:hypothetical protein
VTALRAVLCDPTACELCAGRSMVSVEFVGQVQPVRTVPCPLHVDGTALAALVQRVCPPTPPKEAA